MFTLFTGEGIQISALQGFLFLVAETLNVRMRRRSGVRLPGKSQVLSREFNGLAANRHDFKASTFEQISTGGYRAKRGTGIRQRDSEHSRTGSKDARCWRRTGCHCGKRHKATDLQQSSPLSQCVSRRHVEQAGGARNHVIGLGTILGQGSRVALDEFNIRQACLLYGRARLCKHARRDVDAAYMAFDPHQPGGSQSSEACSRPRVQDPAAGSNVAQRHKPFRAASVPIIQGIPGRPRVERLRDLAYVRRQLVDRR